MVALHQALDYPWEKWTVFLHRAQRALVERRTNGPARVTGHFNDEPEKPFTHAVIDEAQDISIPQLRLLRAIVPDEIGLFVRTEDQLDRARQAAGCRWVVLEDRPEAPEGRITIGTMHLVKGLEFEAVGVMACDDRVLPLQSRIESAAEEAEPDEIFATERHLLYVACTRARDHLLVTGLEPGSEFVADLVTGA